MSNKKENGKTDVNVDMRNGKLKFEVSIFSLTTAAGAAFNILLKYDSSAMPYVYETWNREVNTGLLGSGWSLNIEDNIFAVVDGADLRYFLAFKGMLFTLMQDEVTTDKITYKTSPISNYIVEYVTQGYFMLYDEYGIKYIFGRDDSFSVNEKGAYNSFTGMYEKSSDEYLNVRKKISHPTGDNDPVSPDVDNTISSTRENSVSWGEWNGPSVNTLNQFSKTTCWRLSHIMDAFGGMIVFSYIQHISNVAKGEESKQYCICSYLYRITVYLNQIETEKILFEYEEKKSEEYCIDYTLLERPNGIQYKFQKLFLSQIVHCKNMIEDKIYSFNTDFIQLADNIEFLSKRQLYKIEIKRKFEEKVMFEPGYSFEYYNYK